MRNFGTRAGDAAATAQGRPLGGDLLWLATVDTSWRRLSLAGKVRSRLSKAAWGGVQGPSRTLATLVGFLAQRRHRHGDRYRHALLWDQVPGLKQKRAETDTDREGGKRA